MDEQLSQDRSVPPNADQEIKVLLRKIEQRLDFLENKIDTLIAQSASRPPQERHFSKPFRPFRHDGNRRPEEGFEHKKHGFGKHKKPFSFKRREHR